MIECNGSVSATHLMQEINDVNADNYIPGSNVVNEKLKEGDVGENEGGVVFVDPKRRRVVGLDEVANGLGLDASGPNDIELRITGYSQRHIDAIIRFAAGLPEWRYTGFYGKFWLAYGLPWGCSRGTILLDWLKDKFDSLTTFELTHFITICWGIWNARNKNIWNKVDSLPKLVVQHSLSYLKEWKSVRTPPLSAICSQRNQVKWVKPSNGFLKLNIDASVHSDTSHVGMGWILRDQDGYFVAAQTETRPSPLLPREAEALAIREALSWLKDHQ
nr:uncharacterized protein LOC109159918 [Ipomoea batatas]